MHSVALGRFTKRFYYDRLPSRLLVDLRNSTHWAKTAIAFAITFYLTLSCLDANSPFFAKQLKHIGPIIARRWAYLRASRVGGGDVETFGRAIIIGRMGVSYANFVTSGKAFRTKPAQWRAQWRIRRVANSRRARLYARWREIPKTDQIAIPRKGSFCPSVRRRQEPTLPGRCVEAKETTYAPK